MSGASGPGPWRSRAPLWRALAAVAGALLLAAAAAVVVALTRSPGAAGGPQRGAATRTVGGGVTETGTGGGSGGVTGGATGTATTATAPPPPAVTRPALGAPAVAQFGANVNLLFNTLTNTPAQIDAQLRTLQATGATVARSDALWEATEPTAPVGGRHHYAWAFDDRIAGSLAAHSLTWLPILDYSAPWAQSIPGQDHSPPRADADYAAYAAAFAARYGPGGSFWRVHPSLPAEPVTAIEIWNEPDNAEFWTPHPDAAAYAALYLAARAAVDAVAPTVRVLVGGLTDPPGFLPAMLAAAPALRGHLDGVAIHPYGDPPVLLSRVRGARQTLTALGLAAVPLYVTEFGWTTSPPGAIAYAPAAQRPGFIADALRALRGGTCGVAATILYTWVSPESNSADPQQWYGISNPADPAAPNPDTLAFTAGLRAAAGAPRSQGC